jgi:hypothetical protein
MARLGKGSKMTIATLELPNFFTLELETNVHPVTGESDVTATVVNAGGEVVPIALSGGPRHARCHNIVGSAGLLGAIISIATELANGHRQP